MWGMRESLIGLWRSTAVRRNASCCYSSTPPHLLDELRRLFKLVHPDLFQRYPQQQQTNQRSFQLLQEYLSLAKGAQSSSSVPVYNFEFYVQHEQLEHHESKGMKKVELSLPPPQTTIHGADMLPSTRTALSRLLSAFGLSSEFCGSLTGGDVSMNKVRLSEFFQQASELQRQNEAAILGIEQRMVIVRNVLRLRRGVTASFRKSLLHSSSLETQHQALHNLARALDTVPEVELRGTTVMFGDSCGVDGFGNLWLNHEDDICFWVSFFRQLDLNTLVTRRTAHLQRRAKEIRAAYMMEVEMIFTDDGLSLKPEYSTFIERLAGDAEADGAVGDGKFHDLPIRVVENGSLSIDERMGYINVPVTESTASIYSFIQLNGREAVKTRMRFKSEEERILNLNLHVRQKLRLRHLVFDEKLQFDHVQSACMRLLNNASKLRLFTEGLSICISDEYKLPLEGTRSVMHLSWNFSMTQL